MKIFLANLPDDVLKDFTKEFADECISKLLMDPLFVADSADIGVDRFTAIFRKGFISAVYALTETDFRIKTVSNGSELVQ